MGRIQKFLFFKALCDFSYFIYKKSKILTKFDFLMILIFFYNTDFIINWKPEYKVYNIHFIFIPIVILKY